ncbi:MAG TPA: hypothetical protein VGH90_11280, partial [Chthoniobacteraceae bacterium]
MIPCLCRSLSFAAAAALLFEPTLVRAQDAPPVDASQILNALKTIKDQETAQIKATRTKALQDALACAGDAARALDSWEDAVRATQFDGASREATQFREWKDKEGDVLKSGDCQTALHLYFNWLAITLQHTGGVKVHDQLPAILSHVSQVISDQEAVSALDDTAKKEKELEPNRRENRRGGPVVGPGRKVGDDEIKRMHDQILRALPGSMIVQYWRIDDLVGEAGKRGDSQAGAGWETNPGNIDGIYERIIQPEYRAAKDPHVVDYWDQKLRVESEAASRSKLAFEIDKFNTVRKQQILWKRAEDVLSIGMKNRAISDMFKLIQAFPKHPDAPSWVSELEQTLAPAPPPAAAASTVPAAAATATLTP